MCWCCCGPKPCLCWFCFSMVPCIITIGLFAAFENYFGGPYPTHNWDYTFKLVYTGNALSIIFSILSILIIRPLGFYILHDTTIPTKVIILLFVNTGLLAPITVNIWFNILLNTPISLKEYSYYTHHYYDLYDKPPPVIAWLENFTAVELGSEYNIGCCGAASYEDYTDELLRCNVSNPRDFLIQFSSSKTCCVKHERQNKFCASNLQVLDYEIKSEFWDLFINRTMEKVFRSGNFGTQIIELTQEFTETMVQTIESISNGTGWGNFTPEYDCEDPATKGLQKIFSDWDNPINNSVYPINNSVYLESYINMAHLFESGIHVVGCIRALMILIELTDCDRGDLHDMIKEYTGRDSITEIIEEIILYLTFISCFKIIFYLINFVIFNYYFIRYIFKIPEPQPVQPQTELWQRLGIRKNRFLN